MPCQSSLPPLQAELCLRPLAWCGLVKAVGTRPSSLAARQLCAGAAPPGSSLQPLPPAAPASSLLSLPSLGCAPGFLAQLCPPGYLLQTASCGPQMLHSGILCSPSSEPFPSHPAGILLLPSRDAQGLWDRPTAQARTTETPWHMFLPGLQPLADQKDVYL